MVASGQGSVPPAFVRLAAHPLRWQLLTALAGGDYRARERVGLLEQPQNVLSYHLRLLRDGGLVTATRSSFDGRDSYYHLDLGRCADALASTGTALHPALRRTGRGDQRGYPAEAAPAPPCGTGSAGRVRHRHVRPTSQTPEHPHR